MSHLIPDDVTKDQRNLIREAMDIWGRLADIPVTEDDCIEVPFESFSAGTDKFEIWHWIEGEYDVSVAWLLGHKVHPITGASLNLDYGDEFIITLDDKLVCTPSYPAECDYVRICNLDGEEVLYWTSTEWEENPTEVMGAIMAAIGNPLDEWEEDVKK